MHLGDNEIAAFKKDEKPAVPKEFRY